MDTKKDREILQEILKKLIKKKILIVGGTGFIGFHFILTVYKKLASSKPFNKKTNKEKKNCKCKIFNL